MEGKSMTEGTPWKHILKFVFPVLAGSLLEFFLCFSRWQRVSLPGTAWWRHNVTGGLCDYVVVLSERTLGKEYHGAVIEY